jgi:glycosyltransferase involved in cell wall biosynthesis
VAGNLAILCDRVDDTGGAERYWSTVIPALLARDADVRLVARSVGGEHAFGVPATEIRWASEEEPPSWSAADRVRRFLEAMHADTVITAGVFDRNVLRAVRENARHWVVRIHDHRMFCPHGDRMFPQFSGICSHPMGTRCAVNAFVRGCMHGAHPASLTRLNDRLAMRDEIVRADAVLVSTTHMRDTVANNGVAGDRIAITPPPLPDDAFCAEPAPMPERATILFAGRLTPQKGLRSLIRALGLIQGSRRPRLIVAGRGEDEEQRARSLAIALGVEVEWAGWLAPAALRAALDRSTAIAVPSLWPEPFGLVGSEAQARGRPAVAYDVGGIGEWIADAGITVPRENERALARAMLTIAEPNAWPALSRRARMRAERYRLETHLAALTPVLGRYGAASRSNCSVVGAINGSANRAESAGASGSDASSS